MFKEDETQYCEECQKWAEKCEKLKNAIKEIKNGASIKRSMFINIMVSHDYACYLMTDLEIIIE